MRQTEPSRERWLVVGLALAVAVVTLACHWPVLNARALSIDDDQYLTENPLVQNPSWASARRFVGEVLTPSTVEGYYQPLAMISLMLDCELGGRPDRLRVFHRTSLALHAVNVVLVVLLLYALFRNAWAAAAVGLIFGVHPMTVEAVAWVGERKTLLAAFFALLSLLAYVRYCRRPRWPLLAASLVLFVLALMSKPTATLLPAMMLIMDCWPLRRFSWRAVVEKLPFLAVSVVSAVITVVSQRHTAQLIMPKVATLPQILLGFCHSIFLYASKMIWPVHLTSVYPQPSPMSVSTPGVLMAVLVTFSFLVLLVASLRWMRAPAAGWTMFLLMILPTMGGIGFGIALASDKYAYLPAVGLLMIVAAGLSRLADMRRVNARAFAAIPVLLALVIGMESNLTRRYLHCWRDTASLYEHMIGLAPQSAALYAGYGAHLMSQGKTDEAIAQFNQALAIDPNHELSLNNLAAALLEKGEYRPALQLLSRLLQRAPNYAKGYLNAGAALYRSGQLVPAVEYFEHGLALKPLDGAAHMNLGVALARLGEIRRGLPHLERAVELLPDDATAHTNLANGLFMNGQLDGAARHYRIALKLAPGDPGAEAGLRAVAARLAPPSTTPARN